MSFDLRTEITALPGFWPERLQLLEKLGVQTFEDLIWHLPRGILDFSNVCQPHELQENEAGSVRGVVSDSSSRQIRGNRTMTTVLIDCGTDYVRASWFNQPWMFRKFAQGQHVLFSGKPKFREKRWEFSHPSVQWLEADEDSANANLIITRYPLTEGLKVHELRQMINTAIDLVLDQVVDLLPRQMTESLKFPEIKAALTGVHHPQSAEHFEVCRSRLVFDDYLEFQLAIALRRRAWRARFDAPLLERTARIDGRIRRLFPFTYTEGQSQAVREIATDLTSGFAMHRLLQADVGAGKTVVAIDTALVAIAHGWQAAIMAPTELLANQHWQTLDLLLSESKIRPALLTGSLTAGERQQTLAGLESGDIQLVIGTQALIQDGVRFAKLGVVVIDEQHKFGVAQRARFSEREGQPPPHVLVMTATPIPRTVCMSQFGDLDITVVKEKPAGRQEVVTSRVSGAASRDKAWEFLREKIRSGRQLYVVCPLVDAQSESGPPQFSAVAVFERLQAQELNGFRIGMIHGRMKREQRDEVMQAFQDRELDVLVSTTVIEVGLDVPNATLMLILNAERFGLSQLHQLRGRISRGKARGYCFLFSETTNAESLKRLEVLEETSDGFEVAEKDFELRGPGDVLGTRQHGLLPLRFPDLLAESKILQLSKHEAERIVFSGLLESPEFREIRKRVLQRYAQVYELPRSG